MKHLDGVSGEVEYIFNQYVTVARRYIDSIKPLKKHFNPWIAQCILNFINENDSIKIDLEYVSPNEVNISLSNGRECKVRCANRMAWVEYQF